MRLQKALSTRLTFQIGYDQNQIQGVPLTLTKAKSAVPTVVGKMAEAILQWVVAE